MIYLITTHHNRRTRHNYIRDHLKDLEYMPILATDYRILPGTEERQKHASPTLAYYQIAQTAIFKGQTRYIVVEDDIHLKEGYQTALLDITAHLPEDWDLYYLTQTKHNQEAGKTIPVNDYVCRVEGNWWETPITLWNQRTRDYFQQVISDKLENKEENGNIDHELLKICEESFLNFYASTKNIADGLSSIPQEIISVEGSLSSLKQE